MEKPDVKVLPYKKDHNDLTSIFIVKINGVKTYRCIGKKDAENIRDMIDALYQFKSFYESVPLSETLRVKISPSIRKTNKVLNKL